MNPIEHLEHIIGLLGKATPAEIKGALLAIREQLEADERMVADAVRFTEEKSKVDAENAALKAEIARRDSDDAKGFGGTGGWIDPNFRQ